MTRPGCCLIRQWDCRVIDSWFSSSFVFSVVHAVNALGLECSQTVDPEIFSCFTEYVASSESEVQGNQL